MQQYVPHVQLQYCGCTAVDRFAIQALGDFDVFRFEKCSDQLFVLFSRNTSQRNYADFFLRRSCKAKVCMDVCMKYKRHLVQVSALVNI